MDSKESNKHIGFKHALAGIMYVLTHERNFRIHLVAWTLVIILGFLTKISAMEWMLVMIVSGIVCIAEMINSGIELMIDYLKPDIHPSAKAIKDIAAGAVLIAAIVACIIGGIIFLPKIMEWF